MFLVVPLAVCRAAKLSADDARNVLSLTLLAVGLDTLLQSARRGPLGCGYFAPNGPSAIYLGPALVAAQLGGISLVSGMCCLRVPSRPLCRASGTDCVPICLSNCRGWS